MENSAIRKCTALYQDVNHAQEVNHVDSWFAGTSHVVSDVYSGGGRGAEPPEGGGPRAHARGGGGQPRPPGRARVARAPPPQPFFGAFFQKSGRKSAIL